MSPAAVEMGVEVLRSSWRGAETADQRWLNYYTRMHYGRLTILRALDPRCSQLFRAVSQ